MNDETTEPQRDPYQDALDVQDACNAAGVVHAFSKAIRAVWDEAHALGQGTDYVNGHPVTVLFANKLADLSGAESIDRYGRAYDYCKARVAMARELREAREREAAQATAASTLQLHERVFNLCATPDTEENNR